jgi:hypothetical protein
MPQGGRYSVSHFAKIRLQSSAHLSPANFSFYLTGVAGFCSGATPGFHQNDRGFAHARSAAPRLFHVERLMFEINAMAKASGAGGMQMDWNGSSVSRAAAWPKLR